MATEKSETKKAPASKKNVTAKPKKHARPVGEDITPEVKKETPKVRYGSLIIQEQGAKYKTLLTEKYKSRRKWKKPDLRKIKSLIPGTVIKIYVKEGQKVKEGDLMLILEAMKMKNKIYFPMDGTVKKIYIKEEEKVPKDHLMIELK